LSKLHRMLGNRCIPGHLISDGWILCGVTQRSLVGIDRILCGALVAQRIEELMLTEEWEVASTKSVVGSVVVTVTPVPSVFAPRTIGIFVGIISSIMPISMVVFVTIIILMMVIVAIVVMMVIVTAVMVMLVVAIALVPVVFAVTVVVLSKVSMVDVVVGSATAVATAISVTSVASTVSMTSVASTMRPTPITMVPMLLVSMSLMLSMLGMVVSKPE
jgi:hypothetical protein